MVPSRPALFTHKQVFPDDKVRTGFLQVSQTYGIRPDEDDFGGQPSTISMNCTIVRYVLVAT